MKTRLSILFMFLLAVTAFGQAPIWRNSWSTNQAPPVRGTNLGVTNTASGFMWKFYGWPDSNMVARLGDVSNIVGSSSAAITNAVASVWTNGVAVVASGATNIEFFGVVASNTPVGQIGNVRVWIQPSSGTNVNFFFVTNGLYASNVFATNISVDTFYVNTEMQLSNALRVPFGGTGTNTNNLGAFYIGNGTNCAQWLNTNVFANWLSNQIGVAPTGDFIFKSNGFGTNLTIRNFLNVDTNLVVTNIGGGVFGSVGIQTNAPKATLHIWSQAGRNALLVGSNTTTPTLTITNTFVGIGRPDPRQALDLRGTLVVSGSGSISNGVYVEGGINVIGGITNLGTVLLNNQMSSANTTVLGINTNAPTGIAVVQIAGGTNGSGVTTSPTNQYVILFTNVMYGAGFAVETNGRVTANTFVGAGISAQGLTVTTNGTDYISTTNLYFIGQPKITNASGDVSIDITPGAASGAFVLNSNGFATNLTVYTLVTYESTVVSNSFTVYDFDAAAQHPLFNVDMDDGVTALDYSDLSGFQKWIFVTNDNNVFMPLRRLETTNITLANMTNFGRATLSNIVSEPLSGVLILNTNVYVSSNGYVGLFTNAPSYPLHIWGTSGPLALVVGSPSSSASSLTNFSVGTNGQVWASSLYSRQDITAGAANSIQWNTRSEMRSLVDGNVAFVNSAGTGFTDISFGSTTVYDTNVPAIRLIRKGGETFPGGLMFTDRANTNGSVVEIHAIPTQWSTVTSQTNSAACARIWASTNTADTFLNVNNSLAVKAQNIAVQPIACYGALMMSDTNILAVGASYTNVQNFNVANTNWFFGNLTEGVLTNIFAGYYKCTVTASMTGVAAELYEGCLLTNGVDSELISWQKEFAPGTARRDAMSADGIIYLPANTRCSFGLKNLTSAGNVSIHRASIIIGTP